MRISGFHIDGFGIFHDQGVQDIPDGLVLFTGGNESGKTTLMEFIRMVLFGPPHKKNRNDYEPLRGGNHGGRLRVIVQDGRRLTIERIGKRSTIAEEGGASKPIEPSEHLLNGINRQAFERIFAIGLEDLEKLDVLSQEDVRGQLLGASIGVDAASISAMRKYIDNELDGLFKPRGRNPQINTLDKQLRECSADIRRIQGQAADYAEFRRKRNELEKQVGESKQKADSIRERLRRIEQLEQAREPWGRLCEARKRVKELQHARNFPTNGLERFEALKKEIKDSLGEKRKHEDRKKQLEGQLGGVAVDQAIIEHRVAVQALMPERGKLASALEDYPIVKSQMRQKEKDFLGRLNDLGTDWDSERLAEVDTSVQTRQRVQEFARRLDAAGRKYEQAHFHQRTLQDAAEEAKRSVEEAQQKWHALPTPPITDAQELKRKREAARRMRSLFHRQENVSTQLRGKRETQQEVEARLALFQKQMEERIEQYPWWVWVVAPIIGIILATVSAIAGAAFIGLVVGFLFTVVSIITLQRLRRRRAGAEAARVARLQTDIQPMEEKSQELTAEIERFESMLVTIAEEREQIAQDAGIEQPKDSGELEVLESNLESTAEQLREWTGQKQKEEETEFSWKAADDQLKQATQEAEDTHKGLQQLEEEWRGWITARGFAETVRPEGFAEILQLVENARAAESSLQESRHRVGQMESYMDEMQDRICNALSACGISPSADEVGVADLDALGRVLDAELGKQQERRELERQLETDRKDLERVGEEVDGKQEELEDLLRQANAKDEDEFHRVAKSHDEWREYIQQIETNNLALLTIGGTLEAQEALEAELAETESLKLELEKDDLEEQLKGLDSQADEHNKEIGRLSDELARMAQDERLGELLLEQRGLQEELADATTRWATLVVSRHLLEQARSIYEHERQPKVIQEATRFVKTMTTNTNYRLVMPAGESDNIRLEDSTALTALSSRNEMEWSSGLADQVYLAIRFGLANEFAEHAEPLPFVLDDVLVKFDPDRRFGAAKVILGLAQHHQILMFTCDPETREITEKALEECDFRGDVTVTCYAIDKGTIRRE